MFVTRYVHSLVFSSKKVLHDDHIGWDLVSPPLDSSKGAESVGFVGRTLRSCLGKDFRLMGPKWFEDILRDLTLPVSLWKCVLLWTQGSQRESLVTRLSGLHPGQPVTRTNKRTMDTCTLSMILSYYNLVITLRPEVTVSDGPFSNNKFVNKMIISDLCTLCTFSYIFLFSLEWFKTFILSNNLSCGSTSILCWIWESRVTLRFIEIF